MSLNEEVVELNKRLSALAKKRETMKGLLAVEEHKVGELVTSLKVLGVDVVGKDEEEMEALSEDLLCQLQQTKETLERELTAAEQLYAKLDSLK